MDKKNVKAEMMAERKPKLKLKMLKANAKMYVKVIMMKR